MISMVARTYEAVELVEEVTAVLLSQSTPHQDLVFRNRCCFGRVDNLKGSVAARPRHLTAVAEAEEMAPKPEMRLSLLQAEAEVAL